MSYSRPLHRSSRVQHFGAGAAASFLLLTFLLGFIGCDRELAERDERGVDIEVDVRPAPCDSTRYDEPPVSERREVDPSGNVRVKVTVRTCCCCCGDGISGRTGYVPPSPITGTGPGGPPSTITPPSVVPPADLPPIAALTPVPPAAPAPPLQVTPPVAGAFPGGVPGPPIAPPAQAGLPWWLGLLGAPLLVLTLDNDMPDGVICGDDSGLPTGPDRPRCN